MISKSISHICTGLDNELCTLLSELMNYHVCVDMVLSHMYIDGIVIKFYIMKKIKKFKQSLLQVEIVSFKQIVIKRYD